MERLIRLRYVLFLVFTLLSVAPVLWLGFWLEKPALQREVDAVKERNLVVAQNLSTTLERYARDVEAAFSLVTGRLINNQLDADLSAFLEQMHLQHICIVTATGEVIRGLTSSSSIQPLPVKIPAQIMQRLHVLADESHVQFSEVMTNRHGQTVIFLVQELAGQGFAVGALRTDYIVALQSAVRFGERGHAAIVDQQGNLLAHPKQEWQQLSKNIATVEPVQRMLAGQLEGVEAFFSPALQQEMIAGFAIVPRVGWGIMVPQPMQELQQNASHFHYLLLVIIALVIGASAIISWFLAGYLARPILAVTDRAQQMALGKGARRLSFHGWIPAELHSLTQSFDTMVEKITSTNQALSHSQRRFQDFAETAADWFWEMDASLRFTYLSERFQAVSGVPPEQLIGRTLREIYAHVDDLSGWEDNFRLFELRQAFKDVEFPWRRPDTGAMKALSASGKPLFDDEGVFLGYRGAARDVTEAFRMERQLRYQAHYDELTGLINRHEFKRLLTQALMSAQQQGRLHALCYLDLDQFKVINDSVGHTAGDQLLKQVTAALKSQVRGSDYLARLGGDEFSLLLLDCPSDKALRIATSFVQLLNEFRFTWQQRVFSVSVSIGVVAITAKHNSIEQVMAEADLACYTAKDLGRNRVHLYQTYDADLRQRKHDILRATELHNALSQGQFELYGQRIFKLGTHYDDSEHFELLLRLNDNDGRLLAPGSFIPAAERYGVMTAIDRWVITAALSSYHDVFGASDKFRIAINLSGQSIGDEGLLSHIRQQLKQYLVTPSQICFEITETSAISSLDKARDFIAELKSIGCRFALDDFGAGLSSFAYLRQLDIDYIKIDRHFISNIDNDEINRTLVQAMAQLGQVMNIPIVAEGVGSISSLDALNKLGIDYAQGYVLERPVPLAQIKMEQHERRAIQQGLN